MTLPDLATLRRLHEAHIEARRTPRFKDGKMIMARDLPEVEAFNEAVWVAFPTLLDACEFRAQVQGMRDEIEALRDSVNQDHWKRVLLNKLLALIDAPPKE